MVRHAIRRSLCPVLQLILPFLGATADIAIFRNNIKFHKRSTKKSAAAMEVVDHVEGCDKHPTRHAILLDKYIGLALLIR